MTLAQDITRHYGGDWHGSYGSFPAPGHSKHDRGVTVKDGASGDVVFNTFNGADWREIKDECRRLGLLPERERANDNCNGSRETGSYEYADSDGTVLYRTVRIEQAGRRKRFQAQRPDGRGGWINGIGEVGRVPYRLPEVKAAITQAVMKDCDLPTVLLVEGERKADKLASWGFTATAVAFGCKGWRKAYAEELAGCSVVILPDNDDEGRGFAEKAGKDLEAAGCKVLALDLPGLPPKGDIIDWTGTADDLRALVDKAMGNGALPLPTLDLAALAQTRAKAKLFAIERIAPLAETTLFTGPGSAGKSLLGQQLATAGAAGLPCLGLNVQPGPTLYLTCEDDAEQLHWRQEHLCAAMGVSMASLAGKLHLVSLRGELGNDLATFTGDGKMTPGPAFQRLASMLRKTGAKLAFLDNVAHLFTGNENDRGDVTRFVNLLNKLAGETGAAIVLLGHPNKQGDEWSGSTAWPNAVRSRIYLEHDEDSDVRTLTLPKANYGQKGEVVRFRWHEWAFVRDEDLPADTRKELAETIMASADNKLFLACLAERNKQRRHVSEKPTAQNYAPKIFATMPESKGIGRKRLTDAMDRLFRIEQIGRGFIYRDTAEGKDIHGLREASGESREGSGNLSGNLPETPSGNLRRPAESDRKHTPLDTTYQSGAAPWPAAPDDDDLDWGEEAAE